MFWHLILVLLFPLDLMSALLFRDDRAWLVVGIARGNPWMGYRKIAGEMRKLGFLRFGRSSVVRILKQHRLTPERRSRGLGWLPVLAHYGRLIWESDFCTVTTATLRTYSSSSGTSRRSATTCRGICSTTEMPGIRSTRAPCLRARAPR